MIGHVSSAFPGAQDHRTHSSTVNKSPSESMSFITEVICKFIFTDVHMRNNYRPNRALVYLDMVEKNSFTCHVNGWFGVRDIGRLLTI